MALFKLIAPSAHIGGVDKVFGQDWNDLINTLTGGLANLITLTGGLTLTGGSIASPSLVLTTSNNESTINLVNTGVGGKIWQLLSTGGGSGLGQGNLSIYDSTDATEIIRFSSTLITCQKPIATALAQESTGAGSALLGANSPAVTLAAPYKWIKFQTSDGSTVYVPAWK